jgi:hypothetical protein
MGLRLSDGEKVTRDRVVRNKRGGSHSSQMGRSSGAWVVTKAPVGVWKQGPAEMGLKPPVQVFLGTVVLGTP